MTAPPVDEIDVGREPHRRPPWHDWSPGRRRLGVVALVAALAVVVGCWFVLRDTAEPPVAAAPVATAPGADTVLDLGRDAGKCPVTATCRYDAQVTPGDEKAFRDAFGSAGFIGRQSVVDTYSGAVYWQYIRFSTGTLVTVTLSQQPVSQLAAPPVERTEPDPTEIANGAVSLAVVRDGYLMSANAAGLPGQAIPVAAVRQWVQTVPVPGS